MFTLFDRSRADWSANVTGSFAVSGTSAQSSALAVGKYVVTSDVDCFFKVAANPTAVTTAGSESNPLWSKTYCELEIKTASDKIAAITSGASGRLYILKPGR